MLHFIAGYKNRETNKRTDEMTCVERIKDWIALNRLNFIEEYPYLLSTCFTTNNRRVHWFYGLLSFLRWPISKFSPFSFWVLRFSRFKISKYRLLCNRFYCFRSPRKELKIDENPTNNLSTVVWGLICWFNLYLLQLSTDIL